MALQLQHIEFAGEYFTHYYLCNYRPRSVGSDYLSESLIRFKECRRVDVEAWTECAILELSKIKFDSDLLILRALNSEEMNATIASRTAMDWLGHQMQKEGLGRYYPDPLRKQKSIRAIKKLSKTEREEELHEAYQFTHTGSTQILILDDILTTGSTMKEVIRAVRSVLADCKIFLFTLANTDYQALLNKRFAQSGQSYSWNNYEWQTAISDPGEAYNQKAELKSRILSDFLPD